MRDSITKVFFFKTNWCKHCLFMKKQLEDLNDNFEITEVEYLKDKELFLKYRIMSFPTIIIEKNGKISKVLIGLQKKEILQKYL